MEFILRAAERMSFLPVVHILRRDWTYCAVSLQRIVTQILTSSIRYSKEALSVPNK